ncbi:F-box protein CPR1-like [Rutidosis leptorrhynchoides]|uniref:F-box protein CPR1-like n=1 Tax=Rutidosis leptorrhynchoides TaxID=125765 RepID=UPI003A99F32A
MSEVVPFEIQTEIIRKLPIKSLIQFRSVSKPWKALIDSSKFIADHSVRHNQPNHLLVRYAVKSGPKFISVVDNDDDSFPQMKSSITAPESLNLLSNVLVLGSSHGIVCFCGSHRDQDNTRRRMVVLWNPSIRKSVRIDIPNLDNRIMVVGFGVCPNTSDIKLVKITEGSTCEVEVYSVNSGVWRSIPMDKPCKPLMFTWYQTSINGVIYWHAFEYIQMHDGSGNIIRSFNLTSEESEDILLPDCLLSTFGNFYVSKLLDSLVVIKGYREAGKSFCDVWMLSHGVSESFTKLFNIVAPYGSSDSSVLAFRKNGEVIMEIDSAELQVFEPCSKNFRDLRIFGNDFVNSVDVCSYTETLLLLNQSDLVLH